MDQMIRTMVQVMMMGMTMGMVRPVALQTKPGRVVTVMPFSVRWSEVLGKFLDPILGDIGLPSYTFYAVGQGAADRVITGLNECMRAYNLSKSDAIRLLGLTNTAIGR